MANLGRDVALLSGAAILFFFLAVAVQGHAGHNHDHHGHDHGHGHAGHVHHHHDHDHEHEEVAPAFKYSKQANQPVAPKPAPNAHQGHSHSHGAHDHGAHSHAGHNHAAHSHSHGTGKVPAATKHTEIKPTIKNPWFYALLSTLLISLAPFVILYFVPITANDEENQPLLRIFLSFASGGLLGDAFLHLIPHAVPHSHGHGHDLHDHLHAHSHDLADGEGEEEVHDHMAHTIVGLWVLSGIITFLVVEKVIRHLKGGHDHGHSHGGHGHSHSVARESTPAVSVKKSEKKSEIESAEEHAALKKSPSDEGELTARKSGSDEDFEIINQGKRAGSELKTTSKTEETTIRAASEVKSIEREITPAAGEIRVSGYLNLAADFAHNFTDGLAIGASFLAGQGIGWVTTVTILFHEIPHEIGDYALLIQSGVSRPRAILLQLVTAVGAFLGCLVSLAFGATDTEGASSPVLAFTAGGFIYIATVSVIPELLSDVKIGQSIKEILALLVGIGLMVVIAVYE